MAGGRRLPGLLPLLTVLILLAATAGFLRRGGPIDFRRPATVLARSPSVVARSSPYLQFLSAVAERVAPGASVLVVTDRAPGTKEIIDYLIALGQLPEQRLLSPDDPSLAPGGPPPEYVAAFHRDFEDARYRRVAPLPGGVLYRLAP